MASIETLYERTFPTDNQDYVVSKRGLRLVATRKLCLDQRRDWWSLAVFSTLSPGADRHSIFLPDLCLGDLMGLQTEADMVLHNVRPRLDDGGHGHQLCPTLSDCRFHVIRCFLANQPIRWWRGEGVARGAKEETASQSIGKGDRPSTQDCRSCLAVDVQDNLGLAISRRSKH